MSARLPMKSHDEARRTLSRLIRAFHAGEIEESKFRVLVYAFSALLSYFKHSADVEIEKRLDELEQRMGVTDG